MNGCMGIMNLTLRLFKKLVVLLVVLGTRRKQALTNITVNNIVSFGIFLFKGSNGNIRTMF